MKYLTKNEVADVLRVTVRTVTTYMSQGLLPQPLQLGRKLLWDEAVLGQFLQPKPVPAAAKPRKAGRPRKAIGL